MEDDLLLSEEEQEKEDRKRLVRGYRRLPDGPFRWIRHWLRISTTPWPDDRPPWLDKEGEAADYKSRRPPIWTKQREVLEALFTHKKVAVKSGHGVGKTRTAALAVLVMTYVYRAITVTTAPTFRQVKKLLWGELHEMYGRANRLLKPYGTELGGILNATELRLGPKWYAIGFSTDDPDSFQGIHEERVFLVVDEACGWPPEFYDAADSILTSEQSYVLLIGNPTDPSSPFAEKFSPDEKEFHQITISCWDSPNVKAKKNIYPKLVSWDWPEKMRQKWGEDSPLYRSRVLGEFPLEKDDGLLRLAWIEAATERGREYGTSKWEDDEYPVAFGLDVARYGDDRTCMFSYSNKDRLRVEWVHHGKATTETAGRAIATWKDYVSRKGDIRPPINVDDIGVGGGVTDMIAEDDSRIPVNGINVAKPPSDPREGEEEMLDRLLNKRSQYYWRLRDLFRTDTVILVPGEYLEDLVTELTRLKYEYTQAGKIKMEDKEKYKNKYGTSPDLADGAMLTQAYNELEQFEDLGGWLDSKRGAGADAVDEGIWIDVDEFM